MAEVEDVFGIPLGVGSPSLHSTKVDFRLTYFMTLWLYSSKFKLKKLMMRITKYFVNRCDVDVSLSLGLSSYYCLQSNLNFLTAKKKIFTSEVRFHAHIYLVCPRYSRLSCASNRTSDYIYIIKYIINFMNLKRIYIN